MRKREFERLLVSLDGLSPAQLRQVSQKVGSLNERREVQDLTDKHVKKIDEMCAKKEKELMEI